MLQSLFNKATGLKACDLVQGRFQSQYFSCVICEVFESVPFQEHLPTAASGAPNFDILLG